MRSLSRCVAISTLCSTVTLFGAAAHATPGEPTARLHQTQDISGPVLYSLQGNGDTADVRWSGPDFIVVTNGAHAIDTVTSIDAPLQPPWMVFTVSREGTGSVQISPDNSLRVRAMVKGKCVGPGSTPVLEACPDANCDNHDVFEKTRDSETARCQ